MVLGACVDHVALALAGAVLAGEGPAVAVGLVLWAKRGKGEGRKRGEGGRGRERGKEGREEKRKKGVRKGRRVMGGGRGGKREGGEGEWKREGRG